MGFLPNHLGIYDLGGNAWEWCKNTQGGYLLVGCGYRNNGGYRRSNFREVTDAEFRVPPPGDYMGRIPGFRCVLEREEPTAPPSIQWSRIERTEEEWAKTGQTVKDGWVNFDNKPGILFERPSAAEATSQFAVRTRVIFHEPESNVSFANQLGHGPSRRDLQFWPNKQSFHNGALPTSVLVTHSTKAEPGEEALLEVLFSGEKAYTDLMGSRS
jgi:hypothetical protein